jgi:hypothetical protein
LPRFNLKGDDAEWETLPQPTKRKKRAWIIPVVVGSLVLIAGALFVPDWGILLQKEPPVHLSDSPMVALRDTFWSMPMAADSVSGDSLAVLGSIDSVSVRSGSTTAAMAAIPSENISDLYTIQLSAWQSEWKARAELNRLQKLGLEVYLVKTDADTAGRVWHRVRMGHFTTLAEARRVAERLLDTLIVGYTVEKEK